MMHHPTRVFLRLIGVGVCVLLASCTSLLIRTDFAPQKTTLRADRVLLDGWADDGGMLHVDVRLNGAGPFSLLVDTGCGVMLLTEATAKAGAPVPETDAVKDTTATVEIPEAFLRAFDE